MCVHVCVCCVLCVCVGGEYSFVYMCVGACLRLRVCRCVSV